MSASEPRLTPQFGDAFAGKRVLVTGGLGFLGSNLARALVAAGSNVTLVDSLMPTHGGTWANIAGIEDDVAVAELDVRDTGRLVEHLHGHDVLFNLAGQTSHLDSMTDPQTDLEINCRAQLSLLEACRVHNPGVRIVFAGTRQIYGRPRYLPVDEDHPIDPVDVNGINKTAGEWYHLLYGRVHGLRVCVLRLTNSYGPRMRIRDARQTFLGLWIRHALADEELRVFGDGGQRRDFTYVDDAVRALCLAASSPAAVGEVFNVGGDGHFSLLEVAQLVVRLAGSGRVRVVPFPKDRLAIDIGDYYADDRKLRARLGWSPEVGLEEGLSATLEFYRAHGDAYRDGDT
jgi:UDP-glucose 4-epimerase